MQISEKLDYLPEILVVDETTAIPFTVLFSEKSKEVKKKEVLVVCPDFFENFICKITFFKDLLKNLENFVVVVLNFPGQFLSLFHKNKLYNNEYLSKMIDLLLFELAKRKVFHLKSDNLRFVGFGYGCNVILHFVFSLNSAVISLKSCLFFNAFLFIDDKLANFISQSLQLWSTSKTNDAYSGCFFETNAQIRMILNKTSEISKEARMCILKGCAQSSNLAETLEKIEKLWLFFVQSSHNSLISCSQREFIERNTKELKNLKDFRVKNSKKPEKFCISLENTGYDAFSDNPAAVREILTDFLIFEFPWEINQRIAFIDKLLLIIEENLRVFFQEDVEIYSNFVEIADNLLEFVGNLPVDVEDCEEIINKFEEIMRKIEELREKIDKAFTVFRENFTEIQEISEKNDDLISKIMNIQQKKLNEFSKYLSSIQKEIENPLKKQLYSLKTATKYIKFMKKFKIFKENSKDWEFLSCEIVDLLEKMRSLWEIVMKFQKFLNKFQINVDENIMEQQKLQETIEENKKEIELFLIDRIRKFLSAFEEIYEKINDNSIVFVEKNKTIQSSLRTFLKSFEYYEKNEKIDNYDNKINLLGNKKYEQHDYQKKNNKLYENLEDILKIIRKILLILK